MYDNSSALEIAKWLARLWDFHKTAGFAEYLHSNFGCEPSSSPQFERFYIAEIENGEAAKGCVGSLVRRWWVVDDDGLREEEVLDIPFNRVKGDFYAAPVLKFFIEGSIIAIGERFGPSIACRKTGCLEFSDKGVVVSRVEVVWSRC